MSDGRRRESAVEALRRTLLVVPHASAALLLAGAGEYAILGTHWILTGAPILVLASFLLILFYECYEKSRWLQLVAACGLAALAAACSIGGPMVWRAIGAISLLLVGASLLAQRGDVVLEVGDEELCAYAGGSHRDLARVGTICRYRSTESPLSGYSVLTPTPVLLTLESTPLRRGNSGRRR